MTSKQCLNLIVKQPLTKEAKIHPLAEFGLYMAPITGELMSTKDAIGNVYRFGQKARNKDFKGAGWEALGGVGNATMALAGLAPGGGYLRAAIKTGRGLKRGSRFARFLKGTNKIVDGVPLAKASIGGRQTSGLVNKVRNAGKWDGYAGRIAEEGYNNLSNIKNMDGMGSFARSSAEALNKQKKALGTYVKGTPEYTAQLQRIKAQRRIVDAARSSEIYGRAILGQPSKLGPMLKGLGPKVQGHMVGSLVRRASPGQMKMWDTLSRTRPFTNYLGAQVTGYGIDEISRSPAELERKFNTIMEKEYAKDPELRKLRFE